MDFSIVIPSFNGKELLRKTLLALQKSSAQPLRCIVVDDCSADGTSEMVEKEFPEINLIKNSKNLGPTESRNKGAKIAKGKYVVFIDNDILVRDNSIGTLLSFLSNIGNAGMAGGHLIDRNGQNVFYNMGGPFGTGFLTVYDKSISVGWIIESFIAVKKALFEQLGGFDEDFFMFGEGPDLSKRMQKVGFKTYFVHDATVDMLEGHTHPQWKRRLWFWMSGLKFYWKHGFS